jgi:glycosyltransferase involved in cell wall biosynthesis
MNICYKGAVYNCSGYAQIRRLFLQLSKRGHQIRIEPYNSKDGSKVLFEDEYKFFEQVELKPPYINIVSGIAPQLIIDTKASYNIAYSMFETTELPYRWIETYNLFNEIWVPSSFCKKAYNISDINCCLSIIQLGVDENLYKVDVKTDNEIFTFLSIGQWIDRKGWDLLIQAYTSEFMGQYDVRLCIKTFSDQKSNEEMIREYLNNDIKNSTYMPRIMIKNQKVDEKDMPMFYKEADCFILPSRGEAFNLPALEAMSCSLPVIVSDFGGHLDFVSEKVGWIIPIKKLKHLSERLCKINSAYKGLWFAEADIKDIRELMRYAYENKNEVKKKGSEARIYIEKNMTWDKITDIAENRLKEIWRHLN